jgi:hypothetical protein
MIHNKKVIRSFSAGVIFFTKKESLRPTLFNTNSYNHFLLKVFIITSFHRFKLDHLEFCKACLRLAQENNHTRFFH